MMRTATIAILGSLLCLGIATEASAQGVRDRLHSERARIKQGVVNGDLTRAEAKRLAAEQAKIARDARRASQDGVSAAERRRLHKELRRHNRHIIRQRHDRQTRS